MSNRSVPRILIVDDDLDICRNMSDILLDLGFAVDYAHDGQAGLELAMTNRYDAAIVDLRMPVMDGIAFARVIRERSLISVALLVTAWAAPETHAQAVAAGTWSILEKPVDFPVLLHHLVEALRTVGAPLPESMTTSCGFDAPSVVREKGQSGEL
jgi:DNA-binding response OmpR family regulator